MISLLIVDDEPMHRQGLMSLLRKLRPDYQLFEAMNGEQAVEVVRTRPIDLILTDIRMPVMDGFAFLHSIDLDSTNMKVIIITAYRDFDYAKQALHFRAFDFIVKPVDIDGLQMTLTRVEKQIYTEKAASSVKGKFA